MSEAVMSRSVAQKVGIKEGALAHFVNAPASTLKALRLPELDVSEDLEGDFDYIHFFSVTQSEMHDIFQAPSEAVGHVVALLAEGAKAGLRSQSAEGHRDRIQSRPRREHMFAH